MWTLPLLALAGTAYAACNGHDPLCEKKYSEVTFIGAHNSPFVGVTPFHNQFVSPTEQLNKGVRFLTAPVLDDGGNAQLCHSFCWALDAGPLAGFLKEVKEWMDANPQDVVTLLFTNADAMPLNKFGDAFNESGLVDLVFDPEGDVAKGDWPTLQKMIDDNTRLVAFMNYNANRNDVSYILDQFKYYWETPWEVTDQNFPGCAVDRPDNADPNQLMGLMNHMLYAELGDINFPHTALVGQTNSEEYIQNHVDNCTGEHKLLPNVILLDYVDVGDAAKIFTNLNGL